MVEALNHYREKTREEKKQNPRKTMTVYESCLKEIYFDTQNVLVIRKRLVCF